MGCEGWHFGDGRVGRGGRVVLFGGLAFFRLLVENMKSQERLQKVRHFL